jgi:AcrR family transcriptional regulator
MLIRGKRGERVKAQVLRRKRKPTSQVTDEKRLLEGKERIAAAAASLFFTDGYHNTSVREIAQKANVSVGSVFNYFASKEEILFFLFSRNQERTEASLRDQQAEFERLKDSGEDAKTLFLQAYEFYVRLIGEFRRDTVLGYQELKSLTVAERRRILDGETRIQHFIEQAIQYGAERGVFPAGDIDLKAHCLMVLAQSWAVRHWALKRFAKVDDYWTTLQAIALGVVESKTSLLSSVALVAMLEGKKPAQQLQDSAV